MIVIIIWQHGREHFGSPKKVHVYSYHMTTRKKMEIEEKNHSSYTLDQH
jgi:hypothetical protein